MPMYDPSPRSKLLAALATSISEKGIKDSSVADIVRIAGMSRRAFYQNFAHKDACFVALLTLINSQLVAHILQSVNLEAPWREQVRQAITAWVEGSQVNPAVTLSWIRDAPALGDAARPFQLEMMREFMALITQLTDNPDMIAEGIEPPSEDQVVMLIGGLRELLARQVEQARPLSDITDSAVRATIALLTGPAG